MPAPAFGIQGVVNARKLLDDARLALMKEHDVYLVADLFGGHHDLVESHRDWSDKGVSDVSVLTDVRFVMQAGVVHRLEH